MSILNRNPPAADHRLPYGEHSSQFGDLWMPAVAPSGRVPLLVFLHGGWWKSAFSLDYGGELCQAMKRLGVAVWSIEYRRVGDPGGGWPGTMQDAAAGMDFVAHLAAAYPIDTSHVVAAGHSAGGQLAFLLAARHHIPQTSPLSAEQPKVALRAVVSLAGALDLRLVIDETHFFSFSEGGPAVRALLGGSPQAVPDRFAAANPAQLLPLSLPQILVQGSEDQQMPATIPTSWQRAATRQGDSVEMHIVPGADHFDVVDPTTSAWPVTREALLKHLRP